MPNMDGFELCRRIREISHIPLIVLTGLEETGEKVQAFSAGADDYVTKPVSGRELVARVEACLRRAQWPPVADDSSVYSDPLLMVDHSRLRRINTPRSPKPRAHHPPATAWSLSSTYRKEGSTEVNFGDSVSPPNSDINRELKQKYGPDRAGLDRHFQVRRAL